MKRSSGSQVDLVEVQRLIDQLRREMHAEIDKLYREIKTWRDISDAHYGKKP